MKKQFACFIFIFCIALFIPFQAYSQDAAAIENQLMNLDAQTIQSLPPDIQSKIQQVQKDRISGVIKEAETQKVDEKPEAVKTLEEDVEKEKQKFESVLEHSKIEAQYQQKYASDLTKGLKQFGYELFLSATERPSTLVVPDESYLIGPGDKLSIRFWGSGFDGEFLEEVSADGNINISRIGIVQVGGVSLGKIASVIRQEAEKYIQGVNLHVSLKELRSVEIYVVGAVNSPGLQVVPAFSSVMGGLLSAGGVKKSGSLRYIEFYRDQKLLFKIDLYELLLKGSREFDIVLQNKDMIFVPRLGKTAAVAGAVYDEAIFELNREKTIGELIDLSGGILPQGFTERVYLKRFENNTEFVVEDIDTARMTADWRRTPIRDGDLLELQYIPKDRPRVVRLSGHVKMTDIYQYREGLKLSDILSSRDLLQPESIMAFAHLYRYDDQSTRTTLEQFPLSKVFTAEFDLELKPYDHIVILSREDMNINETVSISGAVWNPGTYRFRPDLRLSDLLSLSGGVRENVAVLDHAYLYRYNSDILDYEVSQIELQSTLNEQTDIALKPFDKVSILSREGFEKHLKVTVSGAVIKPDEYDFSPGLTLKDVIGLAGGERFGANIDKIELSRQIIEPDEVKTEHKVLSLSRDGSYLLEPFDYVLVPIVKGALTLKTIAISGEVKFPGQYRLQDGERISDLIERAGGFTEYAYFYGAKYTSEKAQQIQQQSINKMVQNLQVEAYRALNAEAQTAIAKEDVEAAETAQSMVQSMLSKLQAVKAEGRVAIELRELEVFRGSKFDFEVEDGDSLNIPRQPNFVAVVGSVYSPSAFLYEQNQPLIFYLAKSGGPTKTADDDQIYVIKANGEVFSKNQKNNFDQIRLMPGDTIVVPEDLERVPYLRLVRDITDIIFKVAVTVGVLVALF